MARIQEWHVTGPDLHYRQGPRKNQVRNSSSFPYGPKKHGQRKRAEMELPGAAHQWIGMDRMDKKGDYY